MVDPDAAIVERIKAGDSTAFDELVRKHRGRVMAAIAKYFSEVAEREDVAQHAFISAYRGIGSFRGDAKFTTWLHRIAENEAKRWLKSRSRRPPSQDFDVADVDAVAVEKRMAAIDTPDAMADYDDYQHAVVEAIWALPEASRTAIVLFEVDGLSYDDIAAAMQCPVGTVRSRINRAREAIEKASR